MSRLTKTSILKKGKFYLNRIYLFRKRKDRFLIIHLDQSKSRIRFTINYLYENMLEVRNFIIVLG